MKLSTLAFLALAVVASACQPGDAPTATAPSEPGTATVPAPSAEAQPAAELLTAFPAAFRGRWDGSLDACKGGSDMKLAVTKTEMQFWESSGTIKTIARDGLNAVTVDAAFSGEGETWDGSLRLEVSQAGDTLTVVNNGTSTVRVRCPQS